MVVVDSSVWIDFFNGRPSMETEVLDGLLGERQIVLGHLILTECSKASTTTATSAKAGGYWPPSRS
jgi:hypothetical protein